MRRPCLVCGTPVNNASRCPAHRLVRKDMRQRGSSTARGYGADHQRQRAALKETLPRYCEYGCGTWLTPDSPWVAAHLVDGDDASPRIASCRSCNEKAKRRP